MAIVWFPPVCVYAREAQHTSYTQYSIVVSSTCHNKTQQQQQQQSASTCRRRRRPEVRQTGCPHHLYRVLPTLLLSFSLVCALLSRKCIYSCTPALSVKVQLSFLKDAHTLLLVFLFFIFYVCVVPGKRTFPRCYNDVQQKSLQHVYNNILVFSCS